MDSTCTTARYDAPWQHHWSRDHSSGSEHQMRVSSRTAIGAEEGEHELRDTSRHNVGRGPLWPRMLGGSRRRSKNNSVARGDRRNSAVGIQDGMFFCGYTTLLHSAFLQSAWLSMQALHDAWRLSFLNVGRGLRLKDWCKNLLVTSDLLEPC